MNCQFCRSRLSSYVDGELSASEMLAIRRHLEECAGCDCAYQSSLEVKRLVGNLPSEPAPEALELRLLESVRKEADVRTVVAGGWPNFGVAIALGAAAAIVFGVLLFRTEPATQSAAPSKGYSLASDAIAFDQDFNSARGAFSSNTMPVGLQSGFGGK